MTSRPAIAPLDRTDEAAYRALVDGKAKPLGALGAIEDLAVRLALIAGRPNPSYERALLLVFAGDHGLTESGVSAYPSAVTTAMVATLLAGRASANAFARAVGAEVKVVDAGVAADLAPHPLLIDAKVRKGTRNAALGPAMTAQEVESALARGAAVARRAQDDGFDILALGEMGIGNSASAALLLHRLGPAPLAESIGAGAGHDAEGMARKRAVLETAAARTPATDPLEVLAQFGGLEIAMIAGAILGAAAARLPVLVDGFIVSAAALVAIRLDPACADYCIFAHRSAERGHEVMLAALGAEPLLDLSLRLGEGTGALLALPLVRAAAGLLTEVASLDDVLAGRL
ncbi:MAG: nicotinate-nucleotide--dimethylbenzimidazole phosphoribosyltransferase [Pseudomonadota bacterium]|uniref:nicotinate-nucleotide--dimethylbenzimidazole phosphoribosyltransferase n=1 Tax=Phenylobacterium sp. TaxID=1871053 RepID=UPI0025D2E54E|nr:nicotinate-nucleotide--dimethylbenzimidazole phosphoribosyltransferase [Phenylobacterium sp.]MBT9473915.1 nicotinate-nucleotide--dimethylbenzimidazole phosphoribosyltransferase [Phenylobacterium sp.]